MIPGPTSPGSPADNWAGDASGGGEVLGYAQPYQGRPGILTTLGVLSIVFASLGLLISAGTALSWGTYMMMQSTFTGAGTVVPAQPATGAVTSTPGNSLSAEELQVIVDALAARLGLPDPDKARLALALPQATIPIASPTGEETWTAAFVTGQLTGSNTYTIGNNSTSYTATFVDGDITIDGTSVTISDYGSSSGMWSSTTFGTNGAVVNHNSFNQSGISYSGPYGNMSGWLIFAGVASEVILLLLAGLLLAAGIFAIRGSPHARWSHVLWAWLKLLFTLVAASVNVWWAYQQALEFRGFTGGTGIGQSLDWFMLGPPIVMGVIGLIYPIVVLLLLRTRRLREYFADEGVIDVAAVA